MNKNIKNFEFVAYVVSTDQKSVTFKYAYNKADGDKILLEDVVSFKKAIFQDNVPEGLVKRTLEGVHLMLGVSYYKLYCPHEIIVPYSLTASAAELWNGVYREGLGEFYYKNKLDPLDSPIFNPTKGHKCESYRVKGRERALVGIGGGKDSVVACELLREAGLEFSGFAVPQTEKALTIIKDSSETIGINLIEVKRTLDSQLWSGLSGTYSGHVPISGIFAFLGILSALVYDYKYVVVGNEQSSNFGNTEINGVTINHQWSKSSEFESLFQAYVRENLTKDITYFSILRPFDELRIVELFAGQPKHFKHFTSCNRNFKLESVQDSLWCGECPKCLFIFLLLSAFLKKDELVSIYGQNLYEKKSLLPLFKDILGIGGMKPFDCVGTFDEAKVAFDMAKNEYAGSFVVDNLKDLIAVSDNEIAEVFRTAKDTSIPDYLRFSGMKNALILGYGLEGIASHNYLKKNFPLLPVSVADQKDDADYLSEQDKYDIVVKTPGIPVSEVSRYHTTATNIFFSKVRGTTIGITGTKGKSTTSSILYEILKQAGRKVELVGNIGTPMLDALSHDSEDTIYVVELSSYQLEDARYSPDIAVILNLYGDHMTYHGSLEKYHDAKMNIIKYQNSSDTVFVNLDDAELSKRFSGDLARPRLVQGAALQSTIKSISMVRYRTNLLGEHNQLNINAAATVARHLGVNDAIIREVVKNFCSLDHRLELVGEKGGIEFYDDAISTTPESTIAAIDCFDKVDSLILGGTDRGYDYVELERTIRAKGIKNIVLFPDSGKRILTSREGLNILETNDTDEAARFCFESNEGGVCLLSPASPSFSCFTNYRDRGDQFKAAVNKL